MAVLMVQELPGATTGQYDRVTEILGGAEAPPAGLISHTAGATDDGLLIVDVWESAEAMQAFVEMRLRPAVKQAGLPESAPPRVLPVHKLIAKGAGRDAGVLLFVEMPDFGPDAYDALTAATPAHQGDGSS